MNTKDPIKEEKGDHDREITYPKMKAKKIEENNSEAVALKKDETGLEDETKLNSADFNKVGKGNEDHKKEEVTRSGHTGIQEDDKMAIDNSINEDKGVQDQNQSTSDSATTYPKINVTKIEDENLETVALKEGEKGIKDDNKMDTADFNRDLEGNEDHEKKEAASSGYTETQNIKMLETIGLKKDNIGIVDRGSKTVGWVQEVTGSKDNQLVASGLKQDGTEIEDEKRIKIEAAKKVDRELGAKERSQVKFMSMFATIFVLILAVTVIFITDSYPYSITPSEIRNIEENIEQLYLEQRARDEAANINRIEIEVDRAVEAERERYVNPKLRTRDIAKLIYNSMYSTDITHKDLTAADELVRGLTFDKYEEKAVSQVLIGIKTSEFEQLVDRITKRHSIPDDKKDGILDGVFAEQNTLKIKEFYFNPGEDSKITYCKIATIKTSETHIDMALMLFNLDFKLTPTKIETVEKVYLLWFIPWGTKKKIEIIERNLSEQDQNKLINFFRAKALQGFTKEYPSVTDKSEADMNGQFSTNSGPKKEANKADLNAT